MIGRLGGAAIVVGGAVLSSGCSLVFDLGRTQCETTADCAGFAGSTCQDNVCVAPATGPGTGGAGSGGSGGSGGTGGADDPRWSCLGSFQTPKPPAGQNIEQILRFEYATGAPGTPPPITKLTLCTSLDFECDTTGTGQDLGLPDDTGTVFFQVPPKTQGFIAVECATPDDCFPTITHLQEPVVLPMKENLTRMVTPGVFNALVVAAKQEYFDTHAPAVLTLEDCNDDRAAGVVFETLDGDDKTVGFYFNGTLPDTEATQTDDQGAAGFLNLPIQIINVIARRADNGQFIGKATFTPRAGTISYVPIGPTPE